MVMVLMILQVKLFQIVDVINYFYYLVTKGSYENCIYINNIINFYRVIYTSLP